MDFDKFAPGAIIKVKVENFVTYALTEFVLSPSLNMIIGPNGTGKSTFVCAVCLGLAGSPLLLGRQKALSGFIKNGESCATIEITLKNVPGERRPIIVVKRDFYSTNKSDWYIDGRPTSEQKIKAALRDLNIQLDNLCQFLPQEKVADFAKLTPEKLLEETERAIEMDLLEKHQQLIALDEQRIELDSELKTKSEDLAKLSDEKTRFEEEAKKYEAFLKKREELEDHERLVPYARVQDLKVKQQEAKEIRDSLKKELDEFQELTRPYEEAAISFDEDIQALINRIHDQKLEQKKLKEELKAGTTKLTNIEDKHEKLLGLIENQKTRTEMKKQELGRMQSQLESVIQSKEQVELVDDSTVEQYKSQGWQLNQQEREIFARISDKKGELERFEREETRLKEEIRKTKQQFQSNDRIHILENKRGNYTNNRRSAQVKRAVELLRSSDFREFKGKLYESPCLTVSTTRNEYAAYLEELVDSQTVFALTAVNKQAYDEGSHAIFQKYKINVPFRYLSGRTLEANLSREELKELGFEGYLRDFVSGPKAVVQMLAENSFIHDIPVAIKELSPAQIQYLQRPHNGQLLFRKFICGDSLYNLTQSNYGSKQVSTRVSPVNMRPTYFSAGAITEERKLQLQERITQAQVNLEKNSATADTVKEDIAELKRSRQPLIEEIQEISRLQKEASHAKREYERLETRSQSLKDKVKKLEQDANRDYTTEIIKGKKKLKLVAEERIRILARITNVQIDLQKISQAISVLAVQKFDQENKKVTINELTQNIAEERSVLDSKYQEAKKRYQECKQSPERKRLMEVTMSYTAQEKERLNELVVKYTELERFTEDRIRDVLEGLESELSLLGTGSKSSVNTLERINGQIETLEQEIPELELSIKQKNQNLKEIHAAWEPRLLEMVNKISTKFSSIFPSVGIAGEVKVAKADKYSDWRLEIKVKFREEGELKVLDSHSQSGGERAVSTVFYMISMQELTTSPFRVVDEINQGMDARNERVVHKHMVQVACQEHTSQYFLITPKLLNNLYYSQNMRVHCIMAGPWTPSPVEKQEYLSLGTTSIYT